MSNFITALIMYGLFGMIGIIVICGINLDMSDYTDDDYRRDNSRSIKHFQYQLNIIENRIGASKNLKKIFKHYKTIVVSYKVMGFFTFYNLFWMISLFIKELFSPTLYIFKMLNHMFNSASMLTSFGFVSLIVLISINLIGYLILKSKVSLLQDDLISLFDKKLK